MKTVTIKTVTIKTNETIKALSIAAKDFIKENYSSIATADDNGTITVISSSKNSGWGEYSAEENAAMILEHLHREDCGFRKAAIWKEFLEKEIIVNGVRLTEGQSMTVRVALSSYSMDLNEHGLGDDDMGKKICKGYQKCINEILGM